MSSVTVLKVPDPIDDKISLLEDLQKSPTVSKVQKSKITQEIKNLRAGHRAEQTAHHLLSKLQVRNPSYLISDLRLNIEGDIAQIDHLLVNKFGFIYLFETKSFSTGIKVTEDGTFLRWDAYQETYIEIMSPLKQSMRHEPTLVKALKKLGYHGLTDEITHIVLIDYKSKLDKPKDAFENVCRPDRVEEVIESVSEKRANEVTILDIPSATKTIAKAFLTSTAHIEESFQKLTELHQPITIDYAAKFGVKPASDYLTLSEIELKFGIDRTTVFKYLVNLGLITKGRYGWFATDQGKSEGLVMKTQGKTKTLYLPKATIERAF